MFLNEIFKRKTIIVQEGGNVSFRSPGWQGSPGEHQAQEIDLKLHDRDFMVKQIRALLTAQNTAFQQQYKRPIWDPKLLASNKMFSGSSLHFFDVKGINTQDFLNKLKKTKVGDIDTQVDQNIGEQLQAWLKSMIGKKVGNATFLGFNSSLSSLWLLDDPQVKIQIDYELGPYDQKTNAPTEWFAYSHSADYDDMAAGIKGVFHKYINRALTHAQSSTKYVARVLKKGVKISDEPVTDSDFSFAVTSAQGGGMSRKYVPYVDPATGKPMEKDGIPVMRLLDPKDRDYIQNLDQQFQMNYGRKRTAKDAKLQNSFVGTMQLMNQSFNPQQNEAVARAFLDILFAPNAQMITAGDPVRDRDTKFAAVDYMMEHLKLPNPKSLRQEAVKMAMTYEQAFNAKKGSKPLAEAEEKPAVKAQLRKGMPHLHDLKAVDFLDLIDELHDGNGNFKLQNIPLNVKIDGFGGRFGKNAEGKPFMGTSRTEPRYEPGFVKHHQQKGTTDPEILGRAKLFDDLFYEMMKAIKLVDAKLGPDFLVNKQVTCEVLFLPFAQETDEGKLKFVGIHYDKLPKGVQLALVPFHAVEADSGEPVQDPKFIDELLQVGQQGSVMFINNRLTQKQGLDVTEIINPLDNIEELKAIVSGTVGKRDRASIQLRNEIEEKLQPIKDKLEQAIINDPNIIGKDMLGKDYEGIVINSRLGPIKVTSPEQRQVIANKNAAKAAARTEQPREGQKSVASVAIGSAIGHMGHQQLFGHAIERAKSTGGDPYFFIGGAEGKDDPIPVGDKVKTWHMLYPQYAKHISAVTMDGGSLLQKIKHELINPLPGKPPRYSTIYIVVGTDRKQMAEQMAAALMKAVNKFPGYENVKVIPDVTSREEDAGGTGISGTALRNAIKTQSPNQAFATWEKAFNGGQFGAQKLPAEWIKHLMDVARKNMGVTTPPVNPHKSPSGAKTTMNPKDDDYAINYGKNGMAAQDKQQEPVGERMLPTSAFAGSDKNKLGRAGQWRNKGPKANKPAKAGDFVGGESVEEAANAAQQAAIAIAKKKKKGVAEGVPKDPNAPKLVQDRKTGKWYDPNKEFEKKMNSPKVKAQMKRMAQKEEVGVEEEKQRLDPKCWKGYRKAGTKMKGGKRVNNCVPVSEDVESIMGSLIAILESK